MTSDENLARARVWVVPAVRDWWNDCCRKAWRDDFGDAAAREALLNGLCLRGAAVLAAAVRAKGEADILLFCAALNDGGGFPQRLQEAVEYVRTHAADVPPVPS